MPARTPPPRAQPRDLRGTGKTEPEALNAGRGWGLTDAEQAHYPSVSLSIESLFGQHWWAETARQRLL